jgi:hypothetical protein
MDDAQGTKKKKQINVFKNTAIIIISKDITNQSQMKLGSVIKGNETYFSNKGK